MLLSGVEMFKKSMDYGQAGDNCGILLRGIKREDIRRGQVLAAVNSTKTHKKFKAEVYVLTQNEGGRHTPFFNNYRYAGIISLHHFPCFVWVMNVKYLWNLII